MQHSSNYGADAIGVFFRRKFKQLEEVVARTKTLFLPLGAKYNEQKAEWKMPGGARLKFRYLERDRDAEEYVGHSYTRLYIEEATNFPSAAPINLLRGTLRSAVGVPCGMRLTGNPGGPGHNWVKARFITPNPKGYQILLDKFTTSNGKEIQLERVFIPSLLTDNQLLRENDPLYEARLRQSGSKALVKAWLEGNWDIVDGAFFDCFSEAKHILPGFWAYKVPPQALRFRAFDWGSAKPFSVGWYVVSNGRWGLPDGALMKYREWYGASGPNEGLKMTADQVADGILLREEGEVIQYGRADPSIFIRDGGPSIAEMMHIRRVHWSKADNKRRAGWDQLRGRLVGQEDEEGGWTPMLYFLDSCVDTIRTLPTLQHDEGDTEDLDTDGEDHAADETRYAVMSRPWVRDYPRAALESSYPKLPQQYTVTELIKRHADARRLRAE